MEDLLDAEIKERGFPSSEDGEKGWRTTADVVRWMMQILVNRNEEVSKSTARGHVKAMLERRRPEDGQK